MIDCALISVVDIPEPRPIRNCFDFPIFCAKIAATESGKGVTGAVGTVGGVGVVGVVGGVGVVGVVGVAGGVVATEPEDAVSDPPPHEDSANIAANTGISRYMEVFTDKAAEILLIYVL